MVGADTPARIPAPTLVHQRSQTQTSYTPSHPQQYQKQSASPAMNQQRLPTPQTLPATPQANHNASQLGPQSSYPQSSTVQAQSGRTYQQPTTVRQTASSYLHPPPPEVYTLPDLANATIPQEIREQFHHDEQGRVLFFTAPPLDTVSPVKEGAALGHSVRYLAAKARREQSLRQKRWAEDSELKEKEATRKRVKREAEESLTRDIAQLKEKALQALEDKLVHATREEYRG
ncbi:hypothetical protein LTR39_006304, partial [Cryomyces antarcticus]